MKKAFSLILAVLALASISFALGQAPYQPAVPGAVTNYVNTYFPSVVQSGTGALTAGSCVVSSTAVQSGDVILYAPVTTSTANFFTSAIVSGTSFTVSSTATTGTFSYLVLLP